MHDARWRYNNIQIRRNTNTIHVNRLTFVRLQCTVNGKARAQRQVFNYLFKGETGKMKWWYPSFSDINDNWMHAKLMHNHQADSKKTSKKIELIPSRIVVRLRLKWLNRTKREGKCMQKPWICLHRFCCFMCTEQKYVLTNKLSLKTQTHTSKQHKFLRRKKHSIKKWVHIISIRFDSM